MPAPGPYSRPRSFRDLFLGEDRVDGHGYFADDGTPLADAQRAAFEHIARKLRPRPYQHLLDVQCGNGAFLAYACKHFGLTGHGLAPSPKAVEEARERLRQEGLEGQATVEHRPLAELGGLGEYDRITCLGGLDQPGHRQLVPMLGAVHRLLKDNGVFLLEAASRRRDLAHAHGDWLLPRIFPAGDPPSAGSIHILVEDADLEVQDAENLRRHAALTYTAWTGQLRASAEAGHIDANDPTYREQLLELALRTTYFEEGRLHLYQFLTTKAGPGFGPVPQSREDLYD